MLCSRSRKFPYRDRRRHTLSGARRSFPVQESEGTRAAAGCVCAWFNKHRKFDGITTGYRIGPQEYELIRGTKMGGPYKFFKCLDDLPKDIFVENERGISFLGYPFFSARLLIPRLDPTNFQLVNSEDGLLKNISNASVKTIAGLYPLAKNEVQKEGNGASKWFVLMNYEDKIDMDDQGWVYSWHFATESWKSKHGFVRRRVWVKLPETGLEETRCSSQRIPLAAKAATNDSFVTAIDDQEWLIGRLRTSPLDRRRFEILDDLWDQGDLKPSHLQDEQLCGRIRDCFNYNSSADKFFNIWLPTKRAELSTF